MTSALATLAAVTAFFLLYSPSIEKNKIITISKPLVINQERRTPAYFLYQQIQSEIEDQKLEIKPEVTSYLNTENLIHNHIQLNVSEMRVDRNEIASDVDAGFVLNKKKFLLSTMENQTTIIENQGSKLENKFSNLENPSIKIVNQPEPSEVGFFEKWATVKGKFEMRGVGVVDQFIELKRIEEGKIKEVGKIDLVAGTYSIDIKSPKGLLVAEIHDKNGILIGEDRQKIINLQSKGRYFEGPFIQVKHPDALVVNPDIPKNPTMSMASHANANGMSRGERSKGKVKNNFAVSLFSKQNTLESPADEFLNISKYSSTIATVEEKNLTFRKVVSIRQTGDKSLTPVYTEKYINGILEYISDLEKIELRSKNISILIGKVQVDQKPKAGVQVQIENHPGINPIYLDQFMIPNTKLTETSESGLFLFIGLESDLYTVTAFLQNRIIGHQLFLAEESLISYQTIETTQAGQDFIVRSFDAFSGDRKDIDLITPDFDEVLNSENGELNYKKTNNLGVSEFIIRPIGTDYLPIRYFQDSRKEFLHLPNIKETWLKQLSTQKLINEDQAQGIYIGFVPEINYELFLIYEGFNKDNIVYFDKQGLLTSSPIKGGGFIIFNVPLDAHEIIVQESGTDTIYSQVFSVKPGQISMSHFVN